ncbi:MAG: site-specific DNA-methyltransferase [Planctomycetes bacterium]|nr:site-specific DNA-methyltransferase [Planctomycetota bacterium]
MPAETFHACVTDPPYGLAFMGKEWDHGLPGEPFWREVLRVLKPGAHLLAFGGTRTFHRLACAIEDAGFEIRDCVMWVYGSGFPKSLDVSKAIDKAAGTGGMFGAPKSAAHAGWIERGRMRGEEGHEGYQRPWMDDANAVDRNARQYIGGTPAARLWSGYGTALKPAWEPILVARKPLSGTVAENCIEHGCGAINVDGCRVETSDTYSYPNGPGGKSHHYSSDKRSSEVRPNPTESHRLGRWPANLIHDGSEEVVGRFPHSSSGANPTRRSGLGYKGADGQTECKAPRGSDSGSASRFFYCAKASKAERDAGCEELPRRNTELTFNGEEGFAGRTQNDNGEWMNTDKGNRVPPRNHHPTVKPVALMRYLCRLVKMPGDTLILDPFAGSGSTGIAALAEGCRFVGIEKEPDYAEIARARIRHAERGEPAKTKKQRKPERQMELV